MSPESHPERESEVDGQSIDEVHLGDALAEDDRLAEALPKIAALANEDAPGGWPVTEFLKSVWDYCNPAWTFASKAFTAGVKRFTDVEVRKITARGNAKEKQILAEGQREIDGGDAEIKKAQAEKIRAEARVIDAKAGEVLAATARRDEVLKVLLAKGIDFQAEQRDDLLRIAFTKKKLTGSDESE